VRGRHLLARYRKATVVEIVRANSPQTGFFAREISSRQALFAFRKRGTGELGWPELLERCQTLFCRGVDREEP
jgi:hypothetical protein